MSSRAVRRSLAYGVPFALVSAVAVAATATGAPVPEGRDTARVTGSASLPDIPLGAFSNGLLPGGVADDRGVDLGGIGSDLYPAGRDGEFWTVTDRGPNGQIKIDGKKRRTFPVPGFDPAVVKVRDVRGTLKVIEAFPLTTRSGKPVTGLPNQAARDEAPYTYDARTALAHAPGAL